jgi:GT2 family glycosyltransferase
VLCDEPRVKRTAVRMWKTVLLLPAASRRWGPLGAISRAVRVWRSGGISAVFGKMHQLAALEAPVQRGHIAAAGSDGSRGFLHLDEDFGVDLDQWQRFLSYRAAASGGKRKVRSGVWILVTGNKGSTKAEATLRSIEESDLTTLGARVADVADFGTTLEALLADAAPSDLVWFLRAGDRIDSVAVRLLCEAESTCADFCLFDTYFVEGNRVYPQLHPGLNEIFGLNCNYFRSRFIARAEAICQVVGKTVPGDAYLVACALIAARHGGKRVLGAHLPQGFMRIEDCRANLAEDAHAVMDLKTNANFGAVSRGRVAAYDRSVSVVICTRNKGHLLRQLVRSARETAGDIIREILIVSHHTSNPYALKTLTDLRNSNRARIIAYEGPFNFSRQCNLAAREASAPYLLFLNDDVVPITVDWLVQLLLPFQNPDVGISGPLLLYPDERVQHAGMFMGYDGLAGHTLRAARLWEGDYLFMTQAPREVSCLTGAAMVIERSLFEDLNGFDPLLGTYLQDVDLSLRVNRLGRRLIFNPRAILLHMESATLSDTLVDPMVRAIRDRERNYLSRRWGAALHWDPFHNPNLDLGVENLRMLLVEPRNPLG